MRPTPHVTPMALRARPARAQPRGLPVINMGFNELPFPPTPAVATALRDAAGAVQSYGSPRCDALRAAIAAAQGIDPEGIVCGNGSEDLLDVLARTFARPGDEILMSDFGYIQFVLAANRTGARLVKAPEAAFTTDPEALLARVTKDTRVLFLANPNNPTGTMLGALALEDLAARLPAHVLLVLDLAYGEFAGQAYCAEVHALVSRHENVVVTRTFSKAYGLAGARVGWCHAPQWMVPALYTVRAMGPVNALAQAAAVAALSEPQTVAERIDTILAERARTAAALQALGLQVLPSAANFLLARVPGSGAAQADALVDHLFDADGVLVNRTREAGLEDWFRFSLSLPAHNDRLVASVAAFLQQA